MFWKLNMSLICNNPLGVAKSSIWNTWIPFHCKLLDNTDDNENKEDGEDDNLSPMLVESEETKYVDFEPFNFLVQQHGNTEPTESNTTKYILFVFV